MMMVDMATKRKSIKRKKAQDKHAVMLALDYDVMARLERFQEFWRLEHGQKLGNGAAVIYLMMNSLKDWEKNNRQLDLLGTMGKQKKSKAK